jgi:pyridoxal 5'-phosphate synthase pdxT subunit
MMQVGLLGLQGAFLDHVRHLRRLGADICLVKTPEAIERIDRLIIPGGESTVMGKFLEEFDMTAPLYDRIANGLPVWGICAGCILLAETVDGHPGLLPALSLSVARNAYGRQIDSMESPVRIPILDRAAFPGIFIRAPRIIATGVDLAIHASVGSDPVFVQQGAIIATTFHPELTDDPVFHDYFLRI